MSTSMAAALAASLPAQSAVPAAPVQSHETVPQSMVKFLDIEGEIPIKCVQLDGMVVTKIIKHARQSPPHTAHGLLLGLDLDGVLEVSNSFALPHHVGDDEPKSSARHQAAMLRALKEVQADDNVIGFYQATTLGAFYNQSLVETQAIHQDKLRHGGVVIVHDVTQTGRGTASFRAFRLTASFLAAFKKSNFSAASLSQHRLTFSSILEEIPLRIRTNALLGTFLDRGVEGPAYGALDLGNAATTKNLEQIVDTLDSYRTEDGNVSYVSRQIAREKAKADSYVAKRREENQARIAQGLAPLPEEDIGRLFRIPAEPSRLESLLLLGQLDAYGQSLEAGAGTGLVKMYAVNK